MHVVNNFIEYSHYIETTKDKNSHQRHPYYIKSTKVNSKNGSFISLSFDTFSFEVVCSVEPLVMYLDR